jgi:hypothetical protein
MRYYEIFEAESPDLESGPHLIRRFDMMKIGNRRFMFDPKRKQFLLGDARGAGKGKSGVRSSHAEEYHDVTGSNAGFDAWVRGWIGRGRDYPHGVVHFAPPITDNFDAGFSCLEALYKNCGATAQTVVRAFPGAFEQTLGKILG